MRQEDIFAAAIGVQKPWKITSVNLEIQKGELNIEIDFPRVRSSNTLMKKQAKSVIIKHMIQV